MKTWLACLLPIYVLFCAVVPCGLLADCAQEHSAQTSSNEPKKDCGNCTPFSTCCSYGSVLLAAAGTAPEPEWLLHVPVFGHYQPIYETGFRASLLQPPRAA